MPPYSRSGSAADFSASICCGESWLAINIWEWKSVYQEVEYYNNVNLIALCVLSNIFMIPLLSIPWGTCAILNSKRGILKKEWVTRLEKVNTWWIHIFTIKVTEKWPDTETSRVPLRWSGLSCKSVTIQEGEGDNSILGKRLTLRVIASKGSWIYVTSHLPCSMIWPIKLAIKRLNHIQKSVETQ